MTSPLDPEDEPVGDGLTNQTPQEPSAVSAEDALWLSIVENYGERALLEDSEDETESSPDRPSTTSERDPGLPPEDFSSAEHEPDSESPRIVPDPEDHFVPPEPPPLPVPTPARLLGWVGLFGVPVFVLVALVADIVVPNWLSLGLMAWFVGGFLFLVASMRPRPNDDYDDGARL